MISANIPMSTSGGDTMTHRTKEHDSAVAPFQIGDEETAALVPEDEDDSVDSVDEKATMFHRLCSRVIQQGPAVFLTHFMMAQNFKVVFASVTWYFFCLKTGMSPLFPGQWKPYVAIFAACMAFDAYITPVRLAYAIVQAPKMDRFMCFLKGKVYDSKAIAAVLIWVGIIVLNVVAGAIAICFASLLAGVPVFEP